MCRLFASVSSTPASAFEALAGSRFSLLAQADFNKKNPQKDGWGIAAFDADGKPRLVKSPRPAFEEADAFRAAARAASRVVVGHLRAASNPRGVPAAELINLDSTQPFTDGRWVFAHNGTLQIPEAVAENLGPLARKVKSGNDSEVYFWQFLKHFDKLQDAAAAFQACVDEDWALWQARGGRSPDKQTPYTSLNALATDGKSLFGFCHATARGLAVCASCTPGQPWSRMSFARRGETVLIASEPSDEGRWELFNPPEVVAVTPEGRGLSVARRKIKAPQISFEEAVRP